MMRPTTFFRSAAVITVLLLTLISGAKNLSAQTVIVSLRQPPPNQLKVADLWEITLINTTTTTLRVYLHGTATEARAGQIVDAQSAQFDLPPGTHVHNGNTVAPIKVNSSNPKYKDALLRTGQVPTGNYRVCVDVRAVPSDAVLGSDCYDQEVQVLSPPILVNPTDASSVEERQPTFSWLPPSPLTPGQPVIYRIKIVEVLGRQTPYDAMQSNPAWFERGDLRAVVTPYPVNARAFAPKKKYAWQIRALNSDGRLLGESEIWWFTYQPPTEDPGRDKPPVIDTKIVTFNSGPVDSSYVKLNRGMVFMSGESFVESSRIPKVSADIKLLELIDKDKQKENVKKFFEGLLGTCSGSSFTLKMPVDKIKTVSPTNMDIAPDKLNILLPYDAAAPLGKP